MPDARTLTSFLWLIVSGLACTSSDAPPPPPTVPPGDTTATLDTGEQGETGDSSSGTDTIDTATVDPIPGVDSHLDTRDFGFLYWPVNHWSTWGTYDDIQHVETGFYGLSIDVSGANVTHLGIFEDAATASGVMKRGAEVVTSLPSAEVTYSLNHDGMQREANAFMGTGGATTNPSELIDMGRFMQRIEVPEVTYEGTGEFTGSIQLAAMTRHFVLTHRVVPAGGAETLDIQLTLSGLGETPSL